MTMKEMGTELFFRLTEKINLSPFLLSYISIG